MKSFVLRFCAVLLLFLGFTAAAQAQSQYFLKLDDVKGNSTTASFKDQIAATGFIFFITNTSIYVTAVGKAVPGDLVVTKYVDNASPVLAQAASSGQPFQQAILSVLQSVRGEEKVFYTIILQDVRVSGIVQSGASITPSGNPGAVPTEVVSLRYASVQWQVGSTKAGYDFSTNKKSDVHPNAAPQDLQAGIPSKTLAVSLPVRALK